MKSNDIFMSWIMKTGPEKDRVFFFLEEPIWTEVKNDSSSVDNLIYIIIRNQLINKR